MKTMKLKPVALLIAGLAAVSSVVQAQTLDKILETNRITVSYREAAAAMDVPIGTLTSHLVAERPYRLVFDRGIMARSLRFGWPLLLNGILMFLAFQGDKLIVGRVMGMEALAIFAMGVTLTLTPTLVLAKSVQNMFLPKLSQLTDAPAFREIALRALAIVFDAARRRFWRALCGRRGGGGH